MLPLLYLERVTVRLWGETPWSWAVALSSQRECKHGLTQSQLWNVLVFPSNIHGLVLCRILDSVPPISSFQCSDSCSLPL